MDRLNKFEVWARQTYNPKEVAWKRPALLLLSLAIFIGCAGAAYAQINYHWTNNGVWLFIDLFGLLSLTGLFVSIKCKDFWVALMFGGI